MIWMFIVLVFRSQSTLMADEIDDNERVVSQLSLLFQERNDSLTMKIRTGAVSEPDHELRLESVTKRVEARDVCDCGVQQYVPQRVYGGTDAYPNEYPWMIAIAFPPGSVTCGASLISDRFALSAAHCFLYPASSIFAILGAYDLRELGPQTLAVPVRQIVINPMFNRTTGDYDLALVEFAYRIQYNTNVSPICLPFPNVDLTWQPVVVMGWGLTAYAYLSYTLQEATLSVVPNNVCQDQYGPSNPITERMICAWGHGKDACRGDSGGPLIWNTEGRWFIVGVVSFGMQCGPTSTSAGVYTRVDQFLQWILSETENRACLAPATAAQTTTPPAYPWLVTSKTSTVTSSSTTFRGSSPTTFRGSPGLSTGQRSTLRATTRRMTAAPRSAE